MTEMMSLLEEYSNIKTPKKVLLRKEDVTPTTKFVNSISIVHEGNEEKEIPIAQTIEEPPKSQSLGYYLKHDINEKTITNWIEGDGRNRSSKRDPAGEEVWEDDYDTAPGRPVYKKLLKKKVATKQMAYVNFEIPASIGKF